MKLLQDIDVFELSLYLINQKILVIGDIHLGYEESLNNQGILVPRQQFDKIISKMETILAHYNPELIIINGDLKHEFGKISKTEWRYSLRLVDYLSKYSKLILLKGNHDKISGPLADKGNIKFRDYFYTDKIYICHGHKIPEDKDFKKSKTVIIGHEHPAVLLKEETRTEKFKCFLKGKYNDKILIVMPSFNLITKGTDVLSEELLSPFLNEIKDFEVYVSEDEIMYFGKVKDIQEF